jgi:hypothetical protein
MMAPFLEVFHVQLFPQPPDVSTGLSSYITLYGGRPAVINRTESPLGWALFVSELTDAHEHLGNLISEIERDPEYDEANLRIDLGHVMAHLNRAWVRRNVRDDLGETEWEAAREFPDDLQPIA